MCYNVHREASAAMTISLSPQTQKLLEEQMKKYGHSSPDDTVRVALERLDQEKGEDFEDLDPETQAAIQEGMAQDERGEGRPWEQVREELRTRFIKK
jgi:predicted transcriptional regulator